MTRENALLKKYRIVVVMVMATSALWSCLPEKRYEQNMPEAVTEPTDNSNVPVDSVAIMDGFDIDGPVQRVKLRIRLQSF